MARMTLLAGGLQEVGTVIGEARKVAFLMFLSRRCSSLGLYPMVLAPRTVLSRKEVSRS